MFCEQFPRRWGFNNAGMSSPLTETLPISHASTSSYYVPFIFSQLQIHTWTWLKPDNHRGKDGSLSFKWSLWDQIAGNTNGHQMPLTSPSVHKSLWWQLVRINNHTGRLSNLWGISLSLLAIFCREKLQNKAGKKSQMFKYHQNRISSKNLSDCTSMIHNLLIMDHLLFEYGCQ